MSTLTEIASMTAHDIFSVLLGCGAASSYDWCPTTDISTQRSGSICCKF